MHPAPKKRGKRVPAIDAPASSAAALPLWRSPIVSAALLFIFSLLLYWPSYHAGFIIDDDRLAASPLFKEGWSGLRDIWFSPRFGDFVPLTATSFWFEWQAYGSPRPIQHATNIVLQALNVVLLWRVLHGLRVPGAWLAAAVFVAHPLCVTSVTWLAERKNTLAMLFYLLSLLLYLRSETAEASPSTSRRRDFGPSSPARGQRRLGYWLSFGSFLLALLSKSSVVILPVVLLLCAWWQRGRLESRDFKRTAPFLVVAFAAGVVTLVAHHILAPQIGVSLTTDSLLVRVLGATRAVWFYLGKTLLPVGLTLFYPRWEVDPASLAAYLPAAGMLGLFVLFWRYRRTWGRACLFGFGYFILAVAPTLGVLKMVALNITQVADHFQYLALPGLIALAVGGVCHLVRRGARRAPFAMSAVIGVSLVAPLAVLSWQHQRLVGNPEALWRQNFQRNPNSWSIHDHLGRLLATSGKLDEALPHLLAVVRLKPDVAQAHHNLGQAYFLKGDLPQAIQCFSNAIAINPDQFMIRMTLASALSRKGDNVQATYHYTLAHCRQAQALMKSGNPAQAIAEWREALKLQPDSIEALANLAWVLATARDNQLRNGAEAVALAERAGSVRAAKMLPPVFDPLAAAYAETGRFADATNILLKAIALAEATAQTNACIKYHRHLELYRRGLPWRE